MSQASPRGRRIRVQGSVQGVGFRPWVWRVAQDLGVTGWVRNGTQGVTIEAFGTEAVLQRLVDRLQAEPPPAARIQHFEHEAIEAESHDDFTIVHSDEGGQKRASIPPDLATCDACLAEVFDPEDRRYRYPFTNCTDCGPRFTIAWDVPYDRPATTMASFPMCAACQAEYDDPRDRRFHAQPNACPVCGPSLSLLDPAGDDLQPEDPLAAAAAALAAGRIVAIKGLGGFHLACDATDQAAVLRLRARKRREEKPFAVMVRDLDAARRMARLDEAEQALLAGVERPIVLLDRQPDTPLARAVAPDAPRVGVMLAYTPLHHLLLAEIGQPLVMTSANISQEPIAHTNELALAQLGDIADLFLVHDRAITTRTDDSVATVVDGHPMIWRRSRGWVPRPIPVEPPFERPVLAVGAHLKNTFCLGVGDTAWLGPHIGDLESLATFESLGEAIDRLEGFLGVQPAVVAHDLHPRYLSTRYAREREGVQRIGVQHHHAHVAAAAAEHGLRGPVIGVAYDGTGLGPDGTAWGAEILVADGAAFDRAGTWRPVPLAGGDLAMREPWRVALALLDEAFEGAPPLGDLALFDAVDDRAVTVARKQIAAGVNAPLAHGMGRFFDGLSALGLARPRATYEGQLAMAWEQVAADGDRGTYPVAVDDGAAPHTVDWRPLVRAAADDLLAGRPAAVVAARFHQAVTDAIADGVRAVIAERGRLPVVLTGGCFQNARLCVGVTRALPDLDVRLPGTVPPGDGGIALGQAVVARSMA